MAEIILRWLSFLLATLALVRLLPMTPPERWVAACFASSFIIFLARCPTIRMRGAAVLLGLLISALYADARHAGARDWFACALIGLGAASIIVALSAVAMRGDQEMQSLRTAAVTSLFPAKTYLGLLMLSWASTRTPDTYDRVLSAIDYRLHGNVSFDVAVWVRRTTWGIPWVAIAYDLLPVAVMLVAAARWRRFRDRDPFSVPLAAAVAAAVGVAAYFLVPAAGPVFYWQGRFPSQPPALTELSFRPSAAPDASFRNAMPSLHFSGALLVAIGSWPFGWPGRLFGIAVVGMTFVATLATGQHYLIDLLVAIPFVLTVYAALAERKKLLRAAIAGLTTLACLLTIRYAPEVFEQRIVAWSIVLVALTLPIVAFMPRSFGVGRGS